MVLGVPANRVVVRVKRMGGGFGGKESRSTLLSTVVALSAQRLGRPVRCMLDRDQDMVVTGGRHPFYAKYKVGETVPLRGQTVPSGLQTVPSGLQTVPLEDRLFP